MPKQPETMTILDTPYRFDSTLFAEAMVESLEVIKKTWDERRLSKINELYHIHGLCQLFIDSYRHLNTETLNRIHNRPSDEYGYGFTDYGMRLLRTVFQKYISIRHPHDPQNFRVLYPLGFEKFRDENHEYYTYETLGTAFDRRTAYGKARYELLLILIEEAKRGLQAKLERDLHQRSTMTPY